MKKTMKILAICLTVPCLLLCLIYIVSLVLSAFIALPYQVEPNVLFADWVFLAIPILALLMSIFLQIASIQKGRNKK